MQIFDFTSITRLRKVPRIDAAVLIVVTFVTYFTNLAVAVATGTVLSSLSFAWQSAVRGVSAVPEWDGDTLVFRMRGPLFFGSIQSFKDVMRLAVPKDSDAGDKDLVLDFMECRVWDSSALGAYLAHASAVTLAVALFTTMHDCQDADAACCIVGCVNRVLIDCTASWLCTDHTGFDLACRAYVTLHCVPTL